MRNWGIGLIAVAVFGFIGMLSSGEKDAFPGLLLFGGGGWALLHFGNKHNNKVRTVAVAISELLKEDESRVLLSSVSKKTGILEIELRPLISQAQKKSMIPLGIEFK